MPHIYASYEGMGIVLSFYLWEIFLEVAISAAIGEYWCGALISRTIVLSISKTYLSYKMTMSLEVNSPFNASDLHK